VGGHVPQLGREGTGLHVQVEGALSIVEVTHQIVSRRCILSSGHHPPCDVNTFDPISDEFSRCMKRMYLTDSVTWVPAQEFVRYV